MVTRPERELSVDGLLRILEQVDPGSLFHQRAAALLDDRMVRHAPTGPAATPRGPRRLLTIGMSTYDDYDGVYFSVQAIRLYHPEITDVSEILVIDNHPRGPCAGPLKDLEQQVTGYRYVPYDRTTGTGVRDLVFREANADFVLCMDSHVLFRPGALARVVAYIREHPDSLDLWQGPLIGDDLKVMATHFEPVWRAGLYGTWAADPRGLDVDAPPFEIPMQGLGVFACRRAAWPGINPRLRGFGGEEGYVHEKARRAGGRTLCLPFLGWTHRFSRPFGPRYPVSVEDRIRNYLLVHEELGLDPGVAIEHFEREFGPERVRPLVDAVRREIGGPFHVFDAIYCINAEDETARWESVMREWTVPGIGHRIRRFPAIETPHDPEIGLALSHRAIVAEAKWQGLETVLVLPDDATHDEVAHALGERGAEVAARRWAVLRLGRDRAAGLAPVACHRSAYDAILNDVPATPTAVVWWLRQHGPLDRYYARRFPGPTPALR